MKRREIRTFEDFKENLDKEKYIIVYPYLNRKTVYDLYYRVENGGANTSSWRCEKASNSTTSCHHCGGYIIGDENKHRKCKPIYYKNKEDLLDEFKAIYVLNKDVFEVRRVEAISYKESNEFYHRFNRILKAFRTKDCPKPFTGKEIKEFMDNAMEFIVGNSNVKLKRYIARTIKLYKRDYPLSDNGYYYITKNKNGRSYTFKRERKDTSDRE